MSNTHLPDATLQGASPVRTSTKELTRQVWERNQYSQLSGVGSEAAARIGLIGNATCSIFSRGTTLRFSQVARLHFLGHSLRNWRDVGAGAPFVQAHLDLNALSLSLMNALSHLTLSTKTQSREDVENTQ